MSDLSKAFTRKALIPFITVGDPSIDTTEAIVRAMIGAGADIIDLGLPFADPVAEGPIIQEADNRALAAGTNTDILFDMVERVHADSDIPFIITSYLNPVFAYGVEAFMERCTKAGVCALCVPDMPYEEKGELYDAAKSYGVNLVSAIAPASEERIAMISSEAEGFITVMTSPGTTCKGHSNDVGELISFVRKSSDLPCVIDIAGIPDDILPQKAAVADGVIIGTEVVSIIAEYGVDSVQHVVDYITKLRAIVDKS